MKRIICFLAILSAVVFVTAAAEPIRLSMKDTTVVRGTSFLYPISVDSALTGLNVTSYEVDFNYDGGAFQIDSIIVAGSLTQSWGLPTYHDYKTHLTIAGAGTQSLTGTGVLLYLKLTAISSSGAWGSSFIFSRAMLNEGSPLTETRSGTIWISNPPYISVYPENATLSVADQQQFYASYATAPITWTTTDLSVATIDANGLLTGVHAGFVKVVAKDNNNIIDTSGVVEVRAFKMIIRDTSILQGYNLKIPIYVTDLGQVDVTSGQFVITYNPDLISYLETDQAGTLLEGYTTPSVRQVSNRLEISFAGSNRLNGIGTQVLIYLNFKVSILTYGWTGLNISNLLFNENILGTVRDGNLYVNNRTVLGITPQTANLLVGDSLLFSVTSGSPVYPLQWHVADPAKGTISNTGLFHANQSGSVVIDVADSVGKIGFSQNINIFDVKLSIPDTNMLSRDSVILPIYITEYTPGITAAQMIVKFDSTFFENPSVITAGTLSEGSEVYGAARPETLSIATATLSPITGPGVLWKVKFYTRYGAPKLSTSTLRLVGVVFNQGVPIPLIDNSDVYIRWEKDVRVNEILEPAGIISRDTVVTPMVQIANVRNVEQTALYRFRIGSLYEDTLTATLAPWETRTITFAKSWTASPSGTHVIRCDAFLVGDQDTSNNTVIRNLAVVRTSADPIILSMTPNYAGNNGILRAYIHGHNFRSGATVKLTKDGSPDYFVHHNYTKVIDSQKLMVVFDFQDNTLGTWNVTVMNPDSGTTTFYDGFTLEAPHKRLWTDIVGPDRVRIGREQTFSVIVGNVGNIDAVGALLFIRGLPKNVIFTPDFSFAPTPEPDGIDWNSSLGWIESETERIIPIMFPLLHANETRQINFRIKIPWGTPPFHITAGINSLDGHLYTASSLSAQMGQSLIGIQEINWACVTAVGALIGNVAGAFIPNDCISLGINTFTTIASLIAADQADGYSYVQMMASTVKDALFCAGYVMGGPIATAIKVASIITDLIASGVDIGQKCWPDPTSDKPVQPVAAMDPNHKSGPGGYDTTYHWTTTDQPFTYLVEFENIASASAEAESIFVRDTLDTNFDLNTLQLLSSSHPQFLTTTVDSISRSITWTFGGIMLPPNVNPPEGQGWAIFSIMPKPNLASGTQIKNSASIVFDYNPPIVTNLYINTVDSAKPESHVLLLPDTTHTGEFVVSWSGQDDSLGSGIRGYDIYVKYDSGSYTKWLTETKDTSAVFLGDNERIHSFYSVAIDNAGLREDEPLSPDAVTWVDGIASPVYLKLTSGSATSNPRPTFTWTPTAGKLGHYVFEYASDSLFTLNVHSIGSIPETTYTMTDSLIDGIYWWRVEGVSRSGSHSGFRTPIKFTIDTQPPDMPLLLSILDGAIIKVANPSFSWTSVTEPGVKYFWECAFDTLFDSVRAAYYSSDTMMTVPVSMSLNRGTYYWHVRAVDPAMNKSSYQTKPFMFYIDSTFVGVKEDEPVPEKFSLQQNYPNPFNPITKIEYGLPAESHIRLKIYDILGREVITLVDDIQSAGYRTIEWKSNNSSGMNVASGIYFYRIDATSISNPKDTFTGVKKLMLLR
ncbi:MAG: Ig-like domain-containing protein [Ignavibacteriales bacterium]|nr:Ig-like domain-containing protein [Ignavibacteriales bacterium]